MSNRLLHGIVITLLIFGFIALMQLVTFRSHFFDPFNKGIKDYEVTDIVFSQFQDPEQVKRETRVVLVHVERPDRGELAALIERIAAFSPTVIGVDILLEGSKDSLDDTRLERTLDQTPNVVLAANLGEYADSLGGIPKLITAEERFTTEATSAYTNFLAGEDRTIRHFSKQIKTLDGVNHDAFAVAIAARHDSVAVARLLRRGRSVERINYVGDYRSFLRIDAQAVLEAPDEALMLFGGRAVMIGYVDSRSPSAPLEDRHFTPLNPVYTGHSVPDMYGVVIHANILAMILSAAYIFEFPAWIMWPLSFLLTLANVLLFRRIYHALPDTFHGITRALQLVELLVLFFLVAAAFHYFDVHLNFSLGFLALILAYDVVMIYESFIRKRIPLLKKLSDE